MTIDRRPGRTYFCGMVPNTHVLFTAILQRAGADCVCDIGSRDGDDALRFRSLLPNARILAFEANPHNFSRMAADPRMSNGKIEIFSCAVSGDEGEATFHVADVDYGNAEENRGTSSLLSGGAYKTRESIQVKTRRLDRLILETFPQANVIGLWIDVEGAEYEVLRGIEAIKDRVAVIHVETSLRPLREGQKTTVELTALLDTLGFEPACFGFLKEHVWGDAVYIQKVCKRRLGWRFRLYRWKSTVSSLLGVGYVAEYLRHHFPRVYRTAYRLYHRLGA